MKCTLFKIYSIFFKVTIEVGDLFYSLIFFKFMTMSTVVQLFLADFVVVTL